MMNPFPNLIKEICQTTCKNHWCCSTQKFAPPPLSQDEIRAIEEKIHASDFYILDNSYFVLKTTPDGFCIFFDHCLKQCTIYEVRPLDCRLFPFVCFGPGTQKVWILWECHLSKKMTDEQIESILVSFEKKYAQKLLPICSYDPEGYDISTTNLLHPEGYRVIREIIF